MTKCMKLLVTSAPKIDTNHCSHQENELNMTVMTTQPLFNTHDSELYNGSFEEYVCEIGLKVTSRFKCSFVEGLLENLHNYISEFHLPKIP